MRVLALIPLLCAIGALVLSFLCLFAGSRKGFLDDFGILTLNTSMIGQSPLNTTSNSGGLLGSIESSIEGDVQSVANNISSDVARYIDIRDFYTAHILDFCEGYYEPNATKEHGFKPKMNVTQCSKVRAMYYFDPTAIIQSELKPGVDLSDLNWPNDIKTGVKVMEVSGKAMFVLYCIGIALTALAALGALVGFFAGGRLSALLNFMLSFLSFLTLGIASAIATAIAVKIVHLINKYGYPIGISASKGGKFLTMTWVATAVMLIAAGLWIVDCCIGRRKRTTYVREGKEGRY